MGFDFTEEPLAVVQDLVNQKNFCVGVFSQPEEGIGDGSRGRFEMAWRRNHQNLFFAQKNIEPGQMKLAQLVVAESIGRKVKKIFQPLLMIRCCLIHVTPIKKAPVPKPQSSDAGASSSLDSAALFHNPAKTGDSYSKWRKPFFVQKFYGLFETPFKNIFRDGFRTKKLWGLSLWNVRIQGLEGA
jgi:hypothetical protein